MAELLVGGVKYEGWKSVRVTRSIESLCGSFELGLTEKWNEAGEVWPIGEGDECSVSLDGETVITGFVDTRDLELSAGDHAIRVSGRDRSGDLVDCSVLLDQWEFTKVDVLALAKKICAPYNVGVSLQPGLTLATTTIPKKHAINPGESAANAIDSLCKVAGLLAVSDGRGNVVLTRAGTKVCKTALVEGVNILGASSKFTHSGRFRTYLVLGSHRGTETMHVGESDWEGRPVSLVKGVAEDREVRRFGRNLVIRPEHSITQAQAKARAQWEATTRAAKSSAVTVKVQGWKDGSRLWPVNEQVQIKAPSVGINGQMLITQVEFSEDRATGTTATLTLRRPASFLPDPTLTPGGLGSNYWKEIERGV